MSLARPLKWPPIFPLEKGLVLWLPFDERSGARALDRSGKRNHVTLYGPTWAPGRRGSALSFDGVNDYARITWAPSLAVISAFTVRIKAVWRTLPSIKGATEALLSQQDGAGTGRTWLYGHTPSNTIRSSLGATLLISTTVISAGAEYDVAMSYDGSTLRLYVNGLLEISQTKAISEGATGDYVLGNHKGLVTQPLDGPIRLVQLFNRALTADEIKRLHESEVFLGRCGG